MHKFNVYLPWLGDFNNKQTNTMKKLTITIIALIICSTAAFSQLRADAKMLKSDLPKSYSAIRTFAVKKWADDHKMVVFEINKQSEAMLNVLLVEDKNVDVFTEAYSKWTERDINTINISENPTTDWGMVYWEYKKQVKAASSY